SGLSRRPGRGVLGAPGHDQGNHRSRRAASAQAGLHHVREIHAHPQQALRAAARRDPQGGLAIGGGSAVVTPQTDRKRGRFGSRAVQALFLVVLIVLWYLATTRWRVSPILLPNPVAVFDQLSDVLRTGEYVGDLRVTLSELAIAFSISAT